MQNRKINRRELIGAVLRQGPCENQRRNNIHAGSECSARQVKDARVAVFSNSFGPFCGATLLTSD